MVFQGSVQFVEYQQVVYEHEGPHVKLGKCGNCEAMCSKIITYMGIFGGYQTKWKKWLEKKEGERIIQALIQNLWALLMYVKHEIH